MREPVDIRHLLEPGDRRTVGRVAEVVAAVQREPALLRQLVTCLFEDDQALRMRAADALEKLSRQRATTLQPFLAVLLGLFEETEQAEVLWHMAVVLPRLLLSVRERRRVLMKLEHCLLAKSSLVRTFALQGLVDLAKTDPSLVPRVKESLWQAEKTGTAAMKARSRKLLRELQG